MANFRSNAFKRNRDVKFSAASFDVVEVAAGSAIQVQAFGAIAITA
jgi:hypothetical protein